MPDPTATERLPAVIGDLPDDLLLAILRLVDAPTRTRVPEVCTAWRTLAACPTAHPFLYADVRVDGRARSDGDPDAPAAAASTSSAALPPPPPALAPAGPRVRLDAAALAAWLAARAPAVRSLTVDDALLTEAEWEAVLGAAAPGLAALDLAGDAARTLPWPALAAGLCPALTGLAVRGCEGTLGDAQLAHLPPGLTALCLEAARSPSGGLARSGRPFLEGFPPAVARLSCLRSLSLASRGVGALPADLTPLARLTSLRITHATLTALPPGFTALQALAHLDLRGNLLLRGDAASAGRALAPLCALAGAPSGGLTYLNLSSNGRRCDGGTALPPGLFEHTTLRELHCADNPGLAVSHHLSRLTACRLLDLRSCGLKDYPPGLASLSNLRVLLLGRNARVAKSGFASAGSLADLDTATAVEAVTDRLAGLGGPSAAAASAHASVLDLSRSGLAAVPPTAASLTALADLRLRGVTAYPGTGFDWASLGACGASLRRLDVSGCYLEALPVAALAALPHLTELVAQDCSLAVFDVAAAAALPRGLAVLALDKNRLPLLPASALACLPNLEVVTMADNLAMQLPPDMAVLAGLPHLRTLDARKVSRGLCGARPWTARSMWHLARACAVLEASEPARDWAGVLLL